MYLGKFVEIGETEEVFHQPAHPYTKALLESLPVLNPNARRKKTVIKGEIPDPFNLPTGCLFHPRCLYRNKECEVIEPPLVDLEDGRQVACHCFG